MKSSTLRMIILSIGYLGVTQNLFSQNLLYKDSHKEVEYNYAVIEDGTFDGLSEIEKIKYELKYTETRHSKKILSDYNEETEIIYDSNGYNKDWLKLPQRIIYNQTNIELYGADGNLLNTIGYSNEQKMDITNNRADVEQKGYHPGLAYFPVGSQRFYNKLEEQGVHYVDLGNGKFSLLNGDISTTYDREKLLITTERIDENGNRCKDFAGYVEMENGKGYLQTILKRERYITDERGNCLTEIKLNYFFDYQIDDYAQLIDKSLEEIKENLVVYPNPNEGSFTLLLHISPDDNINEIRIVNMIDGSVVPVQPEYSEMMTINMPDLSQGYYVVQVITSNSILTRQFIKQ